MKISFCLITLNEEENLSRCLRSCADLADEIVVLTVAPDYRARLASYEMLADTFALAAGAALAP